MPSRAEIKSTTQSSFPPEVAEILMARTKSGIDWDWENAGGQSWRNPS